MSDPVDIINKIQTAPDEVDATEVGILCDAIEKDTTPALVLHKAVQYVGDAAKKHESVVHRCFKALVGVLSATTVPNLEAAALTNLIQLCDFESSKQADLARETADILLQVLAEDSGFSAQSKQVAQTGFTRLTGISFKSVITKLFHLLSTQREDDDAEVVRKERELALEKLEELIKPVFASKWEDPETAETAMKLLPTIFADIPAQEFGRLVSIACHIPGIKDNAEKIISMVFGAKPKFDKSADWDRIACAGEHLPRTVVAPALAEALFARIEKSGLPKESGELALFTKSLNTACRHDSEEGAAAHLPLVKDLLVENCEAEPTVLEGLLLSISQLGSKSGNAMLLIVKDETFQAKMAEVATKYETIEKKLAFAIKKLIAEPQEAAPAVGRQAEAVASVSNIVVVARAFASGKQATYRRSSWNQPRTLPKAYGGRGSKRGQAGSDAPKKLLRVKQ